MNFTEEQRRAMRARIAAFEYEIWCIQTAIRCGERAMGAYNEHHPNVIRRRCRQDLRMVRIAEARLKTANSNVSVD